MNRHSRLAFVSVTYEKMTDPTVEKKGGKKRTPSKNKSVTPVNVECLFNYKHDTDLHLTRSYNIRCKKRH